MKKIITTMTLLGMAALAANAQRSVDVKIVQIQADSMTINCTDSFQFGYSYINAGPDEIYATDTLYFRDHNLDSGYVYLAYGEDVAVGDTVVNWFWTDHYENIHTLVDMSTLKFIYNFPFPDGTYISPIQFLGFNSDSTVIYDNNDTNNAYLVTLKIECGLGINNTLSKSQLSIYPNPTSNNLNFSYDFAKATTAIVNVIDMTGSIVLTKNFGTQNAGTQVFTLNVANLPNGNYSLELNTQNNKGVSKFVISK